MTAESVITDRVAEMHAAMAKEPPNEVMGAFGLEPGRAGRRVNADGTTGVPMPTVAILHASHVMRWIDAHPDYSTRIEPAQVISALDQLGI